jgi:hypothetical protein
VHPDRSVVFNCRWCPSRTSAANHIPASDHFDAKRASSRPPARTHAASSQSSSDASTFGGANARVAVMSGTVTKGNDALPKGRMP